jgi:hypothetical protein
MATKQSQSQKVIVNIGSTVAKRKSRKRATKPKPKPKAKPKSKAKPKQRSGAQSMGTQPIQPQPQFTQTLYPVVNPIQSEQLNFNLASLTKHLQTLEDKQKNATAPLMIRQPSNESIFDTPPDDDQVLPLGPPSIKTAMTRAQSFDSLGRPIISRSMSRQSSSGMSSLSDVATPLPRMVISRKRRTKAEMDAAKEVKAAAAAEELLKGFSGFRGSSQYSEPSFPAASPSSTVTGSTVSGRLTPSSGFSFGGGGAEEQSFGRFNVPRL